MLLLCIHWDCTMSGLHQRQLIVPLLEQIKLVCSSVSKNEPMQSFLFWKFLTFITHLRVFKVPHIILPSVEHLWELPHPALVLGPQ